MLKLLVPLMLAVAVASQQQQQKEQQEATVKVQLKQGTILGSRQEAGRGRSFYSFKNIPFAQPPVGDLRFKDPVPAGGWSDVRNGSTVAPFCPQMSVLAFMKDRIEMEGSEDCLYLNVFTPRPYTSDFPVMVFIHGGGFMAGSMDYYGPQPLLNKDVVLVAIQYRLGVLGFLSTEDSVLPGNLGLKDQTLALRWVQDNIHDLGGDPTKVTIFGESAGAASVHYHVLSPHSTGLFSRAILHSGTALCPWALREDHRQVAFRIGDHFNCSDVNPSSTDLDTTQLLACLNQVPPEGLIFSTMAFGVWNNLPKYMTPRVDGDFLPDQPAKLLRSGSYNKVDLMSGITKDEGVIFAVGLYTAAGRVAVEMLSEDFSLAGPVAMNFMEWDESPLYLARRTFYHYLGGIQVTEDLADSVVQMFGDRFFRSCHEDAAHFHAPSSLFDNKLFLYELHHRGQQSFFDMLNSTLGDHYVSHVDDLMYLFNGTLPFKPLDHPADQFLSDIMVDLWTNFAETGNPTPYGSLGFRWTPAMKDNLRYLALTTSPAMRHDTNHQVREFWRNLPTKQNKIMFPERFSASTILPTDTRSLPLSCPLTSDLPPSCPLTPALFHHPAN